MAPIVTPGGGAVLQRMRARSAEVIASVMRQWSEDDARQPVAPLTRLNADLRAGLCDGPAADRALGTKGKIT